MQFILITGMSGAGKSVAMSVFEDIGFYCIDNMPPQLLIKFAEICKSSNIERVAIATDIRTGVLFNEIPDSINELKNSLLPARKKKPKSAVSDSVEIVYIEASDECLFKRFKETRRKHPLDGQFGGDLSAAIKYERLQLNRLCEIANCRIDTTYYNNAKLRENIVDLFLETANDALTVQLMSFGFKYGGAAEADLVFDVRCLPNPFYVDGLKKLTGKDKAVRDFVLGTAQAMGLLEKLQELLSYLLPLYVKEGKNRLII
ncbi:MAG: RNase adapter RapZ, partial [Oscillospiraceae bacterium]|nr:RNase adapter RapZ [Oscillospiraceae bacterium]